MRAKFAGCNCATYEVGSGRLCPVHDHFPSDGMGRDGYLVVQPDGAIAPLVTLRDQFAMAALGVITRGYYGPGSSPGVIAEGAYAIADAMLAERDKRGGK